jgi:hypothetical protein
VQEDFAGMDWSDLSSFHLMVIDNLDIVSVFAAPLKAETPLIVNTNAMLPSPVSFQRF